MTEQLITCFCFSDFVYMFIYICTYLAFYIQRNIVLAKKNSKKKTDILCSIELVFSSIFQHHSQGHVSFLRILCSGFLLFIEIILALFVHAKRSTTLTPN